MRIYIAGVISRGATLSREEVISNIAQFDEAAARLRAEGHEPVNPVDLHDVRPTDEPTVTKELWNRRLRVDIAALLTCDAIYLLPGWEDSRGACLERYIAEQFDMEVRYRSGR